MSTFKEFMHESHPELDKIALKAETARTQDEDAKYERKTNMNRFKAEAFKAPATDKNTYFFADETHMLSSVTYTLHVETAGGAMDFGFQSKEKAKTTADLLWNNSTTDYITITNNDTAEVLYLYEVASALPF